MGNTFSIKKWMLNKGMEIILGMDRVELECFQDLIKRMQEEKLLPTDIDEKCIDLNGEVERQFGKELDDLDSELHDIVTKKRDKKEKEEHKRKLLEQEKKDEKEFEEEEMNR